MKRILTDTFEQLEQLGKTTAKQVVQQPKKMVEEVASIVTGKPQEKGIEGLSSSALGLDPKGLGRKKVRTTDVKPKLTQAQIAEKIEKASQVRSKLHLREIEEQINEIQRQRLEQIRRVQEEAFKKGAEEERQPREAQLPSKKKRGLSPISAVKRLKQKVEGWRGVSG